MIELLVGLSLAAVLAVTTLPVWLSLQSSGAKEADRTLHLIQERVAGARFERDLRVAGAQGCLFSTGGAIMEASDTQVVFLMSQSPGLPPVLVEWEVAGASLMRRRGPCPEARPVAYTHALYSDSKTMVEEVGPGSGFAYMIHGTLREGPVSPSELASVDAVALELHATDARGAARYSTSITAQVGR